jgi:hypothetical protein
MPASLGEDFFNVVLLSVPALALPRSGSIGRWRSCRPPSQPGFPELPWRTIDFLKKDYQSVTMKYNTQHGSCAKQPRGTGSTWNVVIQREHPIGNEVDSSGGHSLTRASVSPRVSGAQSGHRELAPSGDMMSQAASLANRCQIARGLLRMYRGCVQYKGPGPPVPIAGGQLP